MWKICDLQPHQKKIDSSLYFTPKTSFGKISFRMTFENTQKTPADKTRKPTED